MEHNLLIIGAGIYSLVAYEIARDMHCFDQIDFIDDGQTTTPNGIPVIGGMADIATLHRGYTHAIVAIGNPDVRLALLRRIEEETPLTIATLVSPHAYVSPSARILKGCIVEPMAVIHTGVLLEVGCLISAGAVINHASVCSAGVHVDCLALVGGNTRVPAKTKIAGGEVYDCKTIDARDMFASSNV